MPTTIKKILILSIFLAPLVAPGAPSSPTDTCESRDQIIGAVKNFLEKEYSKEMADNAEIYPFPQENKARVRSYPGNEVCLGEFCIEQSPCSVRKCTMAVMGANGLRQQELSCWIPADEQD